jgi:beta-barrel assembly-enhancing protease
MFRITFFIFFLNTTFLFSQSFDKDYHPIKSSGAIPDDFTYNTKKRIEEDITLIDIRSENVADQKEYALFSNYAIYNQLRGGNILINDELSAYVNKVADELLKYDPDLRRKIKLYVTKIPETNSFCMGKGYLFVDIGLLSKIGSEAQLAFVLAHEISHFTQKHNLKTYLEIKTITGKKRKKETFEDRSLRFYRFSKDNETEADTLGFKLYEKSQYSLSELAATFDILKYSYLPFEEVKFDSAFFNDDYYKIPSKYFLNKTQSIKNREEYDDTKSTHPNIKKRKESIDSLILKKNHNSGSKFLVSEVDFYRIRDIARFECCRLHLVERNYLNSMMSSFILLQKYPDNLFLHKIIAKSLFAMTLYKTGDLKYNDDSYNKGPIPDFTKTEGYSQQLNFFLDRLPPSELAILALRYNLKCSEKFKGDSIFSFISDTLTRMLPSRFFLGINDFNSDSVSTEYYKNAFHSFLTENNSFRLAFEKASKGLKSSNEKSAFKIYDLNARKPQKERRINKEIVETEKLGINKILVIDPYYKKIDSRKTEAYIYGVNDQKEEELIKTIQNMADKNKLACQIIAPGNFSAFDIDDFNNFSILQDWSNERFDSGEDQCNYVFCTDDVNLITQKYNTKYCLWIGVLSYAEAGNRILALPTYRTYYNAWLMDIETGKLIISADITSDISDSGWMGVLVNKLMQEIKEK